MSGTVEMDDFGRHQRYNDEEDDKHDDEAASGASRDGFVRGGGTHERMRRLGHLVLQGPTAKEGSEYVHVYSLAEWKDSDFWRALVGEFLATQFFVTFSIFIILSAEKTFESSGGMHAWIVVCHMALILICIYVFAPISGAHFNPSVTIAVLFCRRITILRCVCYLAAQLVGAIAGAGIAKLALPEHEEGNLTVPALGSGANPGEGFVMEFYMTFGLVFGSFGTAFDPRGWGRLGPVAIAIIVGINIHAGSIVSSTMNPARAFGPAVVQWSWDDHWVWWVGAIVGGVAAGTTYEYLFMQRKNARPKGVPSTSGDNHDEKKRQ